MGRVGLGTPRPTEVFSEAGDRQTVAQGAQGATNYLYLRKFSFHFGEFSSCSASCVCDL